MTLGFHHFLLNENHLPCERNFAVTAHSWWLELSGAVRSSSSWKVEVSGGDGPLGCPAQPFSSYMGRSWPRVLRGISKFLALVLGAGWGPAEVSSPRSFCFMIPDLWRGHPEISLLTSFVFWMLEPELSRVGGTWRRWMIGRGVSAADCSINNEMQV